MTATPTRPAPGPGRGLVAVWLAGVLGYVGPGWLLYLAVWLHSATLAVLVLLVVAALVFAAGTLTAGSAPLTERVGPRLGWTAVVSVAGLLGGGLVLEAGRGWWLLPVAALPYPLVAGLLVRPWPVRVAAAVLLVALVALAVLLPGGDVLGRFGHDVGGLVSR